MAELYSWPAIVSIVTMRRDANTEALKRMLQVQRLYNADTVIPIFDKPDEPQLPALTPLLVAEAIDNVALQAAGTFPAWTPLPSTRPAWPTRHMADAANPRTRH